MHGPRFSPECARAPRPGFEGFGGSRHIASSHLRLESACTPLSEPWRPLSVTDSMLSVFGSGRMKFSIRQTIPVAVFSFSTRPVAAASLPTTTAAGSLGYLLPFFAGLKEFGYMSMRFLPHQLAFSSERAPINRFKMTSTIA